MAEDEVETFDLDDATRFMLSTTQGRRFLWWILGECGLFRASFSGNSSTFHAEGERNIGLKIVARLDAINPIAFPQLMLDMKADEEARKDKDQENHVSELE